MFKKLLAFLAAMSLVAAFAAVDVNKATEAELDGIKGIGPVTTKLIISERKKGEFKNWDDFIARVKGVGDKSAAKFSAEGLTVGGAAYKGAGAAEAKADAKAKAEAKKTDKPMTEKAKDAAVATKEAVKETAKDAKAAVTPKADAKVEAKAETKATAKAEPAKPAASAAKK